jgi:hypothetical protein
MSSSPAVTTMAAAAAQAAVVTMLAVIAHGLDFKQGKQGIICVWLC